MLRPIHVLIVDDSEHDASLLVKELHCAGFDPQWHRVDTEVDYLESLTPELDLILSDFALAKFCGSRALDLLKSRGYDIPFIMVSGALGEERVVKAIKEGAADFLAKGRTKRLGSVVDQALGQVRDQRDRKKAEQLALEGERKFRALFNAAHDAIYILENGVFIDCNAKGSNMYGRTWDQIVGHTPDEFAPALQPDGRKSREKALEIVQRALAGEGQNFEWMVRHFDGSLVCCEISLSRLEMEGKTYIVAISRDVTERKRSEEQISEQAALLDKAQDAIALRDLKGTLLFWNKGAERIYGWCREEVIGLNVSQVIYPDTVQFEEANRRVIEQGEWSGEIRHITKERRELAIESRWTLLRDRHGRPKSVLTINTDVTEKRAFENQLMRSQRMESIGTLAGGIAHDLNNILTPILTSIELLKRREVDPHARRTLETIEANSKRGADIVRQVLSFARGVRGDRVEIQPKRLLKDIENLIANTFPKNISVRIALEKGCWTIRGDPTQLHQILLNLSLNARDAMPDGGTLSIAIDNAELDEATAARHVHAKAARYVVVRVADSGTGIPSDIIDKIFEPFFTTKEVGKGTGLGLSTVIAIVKGHDGFVDIETGLNEGTTFHVYLPAMDIAAEDIPEFASFDNLPRGCGETVLVVDDEASIREVTGATLEGFGYRVLTAQDGAEAIAIYEKHRDEIDIVLTDMTMPVMDGATTIRALLAINPAIRIIASSGFKINDTASKCDVSYFLNKPYTAETLLTTVRLILGEASECALVLNGA